MNLPSRKSKYRIPEQERERYESDVKKAQSVASAAEAAYASQDREHKKKIEAVKDKCNLEIEAMRGELEKKEAEVAEIKQALKDINDKLDKLDSNYRVQTGLAQKEHKRLSDSYDKAISEVNASLAKQREILKDTHSKSASIGPEVEQKLENFHSSFLELLSDTKIIGIKDNSKLIDLIGQLSPDLEAVVKKAKKASK